MTIAPFINPQCLMKKTTYKVFEYFFLKILSVLIHSSLSKSKTVANLLMVISFIRFALSY